MKILHTVEFYPPSRGGAQEVIRQLSERLAARGHSVTVATTRLAERASDRLNGVRIAEFAVSGNAVRGMQGETERYQQFLLQGDFDIMLNYAAQQWTADLAFPLLERLPYPAVLVPCGFSGLNFSAYRAYFEAMPVVLQRYAHLVFHASEYRDIDFARRHGLTQVSVIANGAAADEFAARQPSFRARYGIPADWPMLLTVGSHTRAKGHTELLQALRLLPGPLALVIIGNRLAGSSCWGDCRRQALWTRLTRRDRRVWLLDPPRDEVIAAYQAADLFVFASNIEYSPLVLYESLAAGVPFLSTPAGNTAEIIAWTGGGELLPGVIRDDGWVQADVPALAAAIQRLLSDPAQRQTLAQQGHAAWQARFTWEHIVQQYEALYMQVHNEAANGQITQYLR